MNLLIKVAGLCSVSIAFACSTTKEKPTEQTARQESALVATARFAVIGDYGADNANELAVSNLVKDWTPDFIITVGDNNYNDGAAETIDQNIGKYYASFIHPYSGNYGPGSSVNRFFPSLGDHDWLTPGAEPYLEYFQLPGNERYYDFVWGDVHLFALDTSTTEPDGYTAGSIQAQWLQNALQGSTSPWKVVYLHHSPYSSGEHGGREYMQLWDFKGWGASVVIGGHDHDYERLEIDGLPYIVNGLGGAGYRAMGTPIPGSLVQYTGVHGAQLVEANASAMVLSFYNKFGTLIDQLTLGSVGATVLSRWRASNDASNATYSFHYSANDTFHRVYIDTDENPATGFSNCSIGANYMIEGSRLYSYTGTGSNWSWSQIKTITASIGTSSASWTVARADIGETAYPNGSDVCFEAETSGTPRVTTPKYDHVFSNETGPVHAYYAENDGSNVFYAATFDVSYAQKHAFIDTDLNAATGYPVGGVGADYMVENGSVYDYIGTPPAWGWTSVGASNMSPATGGAIGATSWGFARSLIGETGSGQTSRLVFHGRTSGGAEFVTNPVYVHAFTN
jgi:hypothetical protein